MLKINNFTDDLLDFTISTNGAYSTHQLDLNLVGSRPGNATSPFSLQFPWPIQTKGIESSLTSEKSIQIIAKKCVDDPWPGEFGGRSKWDINNMKPWKEMKSHGPLRDHIEAQNTEKAGESRVGK